MAAHRIVLWALAATLLGAGTPADAQSTKGRERERGRVTRAEFDRLSDEVERQRLLLEQIVRLQQEHVRALGQLVGAAPLPPAPAPAPAPVAVAPPPVAAAPAPVRRRPESQREEAAPSRGGRGSIVGKVVVRGGSPEAAWVYLETAESGGQRSVQMTQKGKQFVPNILVVERGTRVEFPNMDPIFHNVFSVSQGSTFDLGTYSQGQTKSVVMQQPGVVTVYCNIHPQMIGFILVVPGRTYARVGKEGFFHLDDLGPGRHVIAAWAPNANAVSKEVTLSDNVVNVELTLTIGEQKAHMRKDGSPYGSYPE